MADENGKLNDRFIYALIPDPSKMIDPYSNNLSILERVILGRIFGLTKKGTKNGCFYTNETGFNELRLSKDQLRRVFMSLEKREIVKCVNYPGKGRFVSFVKNIFNDDSCGGENAATAETPQRQKDDSCGGENAASATANLPPSPRQNCHLLYKKDIDRNKIEKKEDSFSDFSKSYFLKNCSLSELADICQKYQDDCYKALAKSLLVDHEFYWPEKDRDCKFERDGSDLEQVIAKDINPLTYLLLEQKYPESDVSKPIVEKIGAAWNDTGTNHIKTFFDGWLAKEVKGLEFAHRADFKGEVFERVNQYIADNVSPVFYGHPVTVYRDSIDKVPEIYTLKGTIQYLRYVVNAYMYIAYNCNPIRYDFGNADAFYQKRTEENIDVIKRICREDFGRELSLDEIR